jgi:hypothetical protein
MKVRINKEDDRWIVRTPLKSVQGDRDSYADAVELALEIWERLNCQTAT